MIPSQIITAWRSTHPWVNDRQVEQDLFLTRIAIEIGNHPDLKDCLAWRGGTCLHKIILPKPLRYSEDLDYVAHNIKGSEFGTILSALRSIASDMGLEVNTRSKSNKLLARMRFIPSGTNIPANIKIEVNIDEVEPLFPLERRSISLDSQWSRTSSEVLTFKPSEMIGTKFRALAQRSKGRDLNDLQIAYTQLNINNKELAQCAAHYLHHENISSDQFKLRLNNHRNESNFIDDVSQFITDPNHIYDPNTLISKWIQWSDRYLDESMTDLDYRLGTNDTENQELDLKNKPRDGLVQCTTWIKEHGTLRRCPKRLTTGYHCPEYH